MKAIDPKLLELLKREGPLSGKELKRIQARIQAEKRKSGSDARSRRLAALAEALSTRTGGA